MRSTGVCSILLNWLGFVMPRQSFISCRCVARIQFFSHQQNCSNASHHARNLAGFVLGQRTTGNALFAVRTPLFDRLVSANAIIPYVHGHCAASTTVLYYKGKPTFEQILAEIKKWATRYDQERSVAVKSAEALRSPRLVCDPARLPSQRPLPCR
jgi:hypothetical protein